MATWPPGHLYFWQFLFLTNSDVLEEEKYSKSARSRRIQTLRDIQKEIKNAIKVEVFKIDAIFYFFSSSIFSKMKKVEGGKWGIAEIKKSLQFQNDQKKIIKMRKKI